MTSPALSERGRLAPASPIRKLAPFAEAARERGVVVHQLNIGQPDIATPEGMIAAYRSYDEKVLAYAPSDGFRPYRAERHRQALPGLGEVQEVIQSAAHSGDLAYLSHAATAGASSGDGLPEHALPEVFRQIT